MNWQVINNYLSSVLFLAFIVGIPLCAYARKVDVYSTFLSGAKEGFELTIKILPALVAMLVAIGMFRAAGGFTLLQHWLGPVLKTFGIPEEILPLALVRPFSGSATSGVFMDIANTHGGASYLSHLAATIMGSTETTFYIVAVYFGAVGIRRTRYAIAAGLIADATGVIAAVFITNLIFHV